MERMLVLFNKMCELARVYWEDHDFGFGYSEFEAFLRSKMWYHKSILRLDRRPGLQIT